MIGVQVQVWVKGRAKGKESISGYILGGLGGRLVWYGYCVYDLTTFRKEEAID